MPHILLIVEGSGDVNATPHLARRILGERHTRYDWIFSTQRRQSLDHLRANDWANFRRYLQVAYKEQMPILWMFDNDDGICARTIIGGLYEQVHKVGLRQPLAFAFWKREYETMFLYDLENIGRKLALKNTDAPVQPEACRGAKEYLSSRMPYGQSYKETTDQEALTAVIDIERVSKDYECLRHFERALVWLTRQSGPELYPLKV